MNPEYTFIRKLESYFDEKFNDFTLNKIEGLLKDYKSSIPKERIIVKSMKEEIESPLNSMQFDLKNGSYKKIPIKDELMEELNKLCIIYDVDPQEVLRTKGKTRGKIIEIRKRFCQYIMQNYVCTTNNLATFFNVHHTSITYYIYGKQSRLK